MVSNTSNTMDLMLQLTIDDCIVKMANNAYIRAQNKMRDEVIGHSADEVLGSNPNIGNPNYQSGNQMTSASTKPIVESSKE